MSLGLKSGNNYISTSQEKRMTSTLVSLTQSKFYSPAFNGAIFDGPLRIYFAQYQEALALEIYFKIQQQMKKYGGAQKHFRDSSNNVFVMLYPSNDTFNLSFEGSGNEVAFNHVDNDYIFGINSAINDSGYDFIYNQLDSLFAHGQC